MECVTRYIFGHEIVIDVNLSDFADFVGDLLRSAPLLVDKNDAAAARFEREVDATKIGESGRDTGVLFRRRVEKEKSPAQPTRTASHTCRPF